MENRILIEAGWEKRIQDKLGVDPAYLPEDVIKQLDFITIAENNIIYRVPEHETLEGEGREYLEAAVVLECCVLLCPTMSARLPKKETGPHAAHELWINWDLKREGYVNERDSLLGKIDELLYPDIISGIKSFGVTFPKRGW